jgi:hypothetical protein
MRSKLLIGGLGAAVAFLLATSPVVAQAAGFITSGDIVNNTIKSKDVKDNTLKGKDVTDDSLTGSDVNEATLAGVNADKVDGLDASSLGRAQSAATTINTAATTSFTQQTATFTAPVQGQAQISIMVTCASNSGTTNTRWDVTPRIDTLAAGSFGVFFFPHADVTLTGDSVTLVGQRTVAAGSHTVTITGSQTSGNGSMDCNITTNVLFVPFNNAGTQRAEARQQATGRGATP